MKRLSEIDAEILRELLKDGRASYAKIASILNVAKKQVFNRLEVMKRNGIIIGATTQVDISSLGFFAIGEIYFKNNFSDGNKLSEITQDIPDSFFVPDITPSLVTFLRKPVDLQNAKYFVKNHFPTAEIKTCAWDGIVVDIPENLSFGLPEDKHVNEINILELKHKAAQKTPLSLDDTDRNIIEVLANNGRISFRKLGEVLGVTTETVSRRYKRLEDNGLLKVVIQINPEKIGYNAAVEFRTELRSKCDPLSTIQTLCNIPDVFLISQTTGDYDLHVFALIKDIKHLLHVIEETKTNPCFAKVDMNINKVFLNTYPFQGLPITKT